MADQHEPITGYRELTQEEIDWINEIKIKAEEIGNMVEELRANPTLDQRWVNIGATNLQQGFMALVRSVAQPTTF